MNKKEILVSKGFELSSYSDGDFYDIRLTVDSVGKTRLDEICSFFGIPIRDSIDDIVIQCPEDFCRCVFFIDDDSIDMTMDVFWNGIEMM